MSKLRTIQIDICSSCVTLIYDEFQGNVKVCLDVKTCQYEVIALTWAQGREGETDTEAAIPWWFRILTGLFGQKRLCSVALPTHVTALPYGCSAIVRTLDNWTPTYQKAILMHTRKHFTHKVMLKFLPYTPLHSYPTLPSMKIGTGLSTFHPSKYIFLNLMKDKTSKQITRHSQHCYIFLLL